MALIDDTTKHIREITGIDDILLEQEMRPLTEEEQLKQFIKDYIDEPPPPFKWPDKFAKMLAYTQAYGGPSSGRTFGYHNQYVIMDEFMPMHEKITLKPTKKQAKLLKKFRRLKRFK